jgi:hypothetical protein
MNPVYTTANTHSSRKASRPADEAPPPPNALTASCAGNPAMTGASSPVATHTGNASSHAGTRSPHGRVSTSASTITALSSSIVRPLTTAMVRRSSSSELPPGIPRRLPAIQAALSVR